MKHVIIGTAGHVDHGKTSLIQALTGTNPDRLKEEQERGMTIDIGFAALKLPDGTIAGIIDVPGHERFLKNMLAGASGVDVVLLVIAADESVMPQTREHLDILRLLDVKNGVVALTKADLVDREWMEAVEEDIRDQLTGSFLSDAPIIRVSSTTGKGVDALRRALQSAVSRAEARNASLPYRLPIDRVFTRPGFGTVVTGTLVAGALRVGDVVEIVPQRIASRVRGLQVHGQKVLEAEAGTRVAVNIASVELEALERGGQLISPDSLAPTYAFDAILRLLPGDKKMLTGLKPLKDRARVRVHLGTAEILGRIQILDGRVELAPGDVAFVQFRGEEEFVAQRTDRFVVRSYSPMTTIGGGVVLETHPERHRKNDVAAQAALTAKERGTPEDLIETRLRALPHGIAKKDILSSAGLAPTEVEVAIEALLQAGKICSLPSERLIHAHQYASLIDRAAASLAVYHGKFPLRSGMPREELRVSLGGGLDSRAYAALLAQWHADGRFEQTGPTIRRQDFKVELNDRQQALMNRIEQYYQECGIATPSIEQVSSMIQAPPDAINALLHIGVERRRFHRLADGVYMDDSTVVKLQSIVKEHLHTHETITVGAFRDATNSNRKFAMQALEYFDAIRFTVRRGDERILGTPITASS